MTHVREFPVSSRLQHVIDLFSRAGTRPHPDKPTPAAGIVLLRDAAEGLEVFITRSKDDKGLTDPNHWSFPTRQAQTADTVRMPLAGWDGGDCAYALGIDGQSRALAWFTAAARVAFMRLGIVLAGRPGGHIVTNVDYPWLEDARTALTERRAKLPALVRKQNLALRLDLLHPWLRWVNSEWQLRRFDTVFFVAALPAGQPVKFRASLDAFGGWMRPADVLAQADAAAARVSAVPNEFISLPTRLICESLAEQRTVGSAMLRVRDLTPIRSGLVWRNGKPMISLDPPADPSERGAVRGTTRGPGDGAADGLLASSQSGSGYAESAHGDTLANGVQDSDEDAALGLTGGEEFSADYDDLDEPGESAGLGGTTGEYELDSQDEADVEHTIKPDTD